MGELSGKVAVITGGATGIGLGSARALASEGATVVLFG
ncbi:MAG: SDR family NAD(P)-dependent oxidoreductase, partial [Hyphomicrobiales bacterium]